MVFDETHDKEMGTNTMMTSPLRYCRAPKKKFDEAETVLRRLLIIREQEEGSD